MMMIDSKSKLKKRMVTFQVQSYQYQYKQREQMKKLTNLPVLGNSGRKHSESKDSVKIIQTKINQHDSQIQRNQKFIISIANDFRLIKQELSIKQKQNEELAQMHRKSIEENQKLSKVNKEIRQSLSRLEKVIEEKEKAILSQSKNDDIDKQKFHQKLVEIEELNIQISSFGKKVKVLQHNNHEIMKENQKLKEEILQIKKELNQQLKSKESSAGQKQKLLNQMVDKLMVEKQEMGKQLRENDQQMRKMRQSIKQKDRMSHMLKKSQDELKQLKIHYQQIVEQNKRRKQKNAELQEKLKAQGSIIQSESAFLQKIKDLQEKEKQLKLKLEGQAGRVKALNSQIRQLSLQKEAKTKLENKIKKLVKQKGQIAKILSSMKSSIKCDYCQKIGQKPVTCIPCGHSFCLECKKGYEKQCKKCGPNVKREAVYRNQLLDQIVLSYEKIKQVSQILQLVE